MTRRTVRLDIANSLSEADWHCVDTFKYRSERLSKTELVKEHNSGRVAWSMTMTEKGLTCEGDLPAESIIVEHLAALRFFYLEKEPVFFDKVVNMLSQHSRLAEATLAYRSIKAEWKNALFGDAVQIEWHGGKISAGRLLDLWFNGEYFHGDKKARDELGRLWETIPQMVTKWLLVEAALCSTSVVLKLNAWLAGLVRRV